MSCQNMITAGIGSDANRRQTEWGSKQRVSRAGWKEGKKELNEHMECRRANERAREKTHYNSRRLSEDI